MGEVEGYMGYRAQLRLAGPSSGRTVRGGRTLRVVSKVAYRMSTLGRGWGRTDTPAEFALDTPAGLGRTLQLKQLQDRCNFRARGSTRRGFVPDDAQSSGMK